MVRLDVTSFLLRWLYLSNMVRDVAEIQTLPVQPMQPPGLQHLRSEDEEWKDQCLKGILSYQPGTQRLYAMDSLRIELVHQLAKHLKDADSIVKKYSTYCHQQDSVERSQSYRKSDDDDPYLDADLEIVRAFEEATSTVVEYDDAEDDNNGEAGDAVLVISDEGANIMEKDGAENQSERSYGLIDESEVPSQTELNDAYASLDNFRDYLPQLVSAILKTPGALQPGLMDPINSFRRLLLTRCLQDANWGIELCWLLEAEVGRAWKTLFEHRQQTGRRLIIVLPEEKAQALAKIGTEKRSAFELLQNAEQTTAYGYMIPSPHDADAELGTGFARLPSTLSLRRCSHFGDTMHFIDRLTQISLDLRMVTPAQREQCLLDSMNEMNRRIRRRMVTRGDVSLDVEDAAGSEGWPRLSDINVDLLKYSVHFPLEPKRVTWPGGESCSNGIGSSEERSKAGVMRVLNIVSPECRILSSRERCPYVVHLEVAETGMEGSDARLFASGARGLGTTIGESLTMPAARGEERGSFNGEAFPFYKIPPELVAAHPIPALKSDEAIEAAKDVNDDFENTITSGKYPSRGGWQSDEFYPAESFVRQEQYEELHQHLMTQPIPPQPQAAHEIIPSVTMRAALLDRVFGLPWSIKCEQIRQASPYGKVKGWRLASFIMKAGEDIRREAMVMQVISKLNEWFASDIPERFRPHMRPYSIMCVGGDAGLLECLTDAKSLDEIKKKTDGYKSLRDYFERAYGPPSPSRPSFYGNKPPPPSSPGIVTFEQAQDNFLRSLVGYSLVCYILQIKDRHNANILMDREGHIIHIDFGFVLGDTPKMSKVPIFHERAPFKLSTDFWEVLGGWDFKNGGLGVRFCKMLEYAFSCASVHSEEIVSMVEAALLNLTRNPNAARVLANEIRKRLRMRGPPGSPQQKEFVMNLVNAALTSLGTATYDWLQKNMNGYQ